MTGIRVLHVDDDAGILELASVFLGRQGLDVVTATSASEGLELLDREPVDCVVSDYQMPEMGGLEFLETVREREPRMPFVLFTGEGSESVASQAIASGVTDYLRKETGTGQYEVLANRIERAVNERRTERRLAENERMLEALVGNLPGVVYRTRLGDEVTEVAMGQVRELTGYDRTTVLDGEVIWRDMVHPDDVGRVEEAIQEALSNGEAFDLTYRLQRPAGTVLRVSNYGRGVPPDAPEAIEGFFVHASDETGFGVQVRDLHEATRRLVSADSAEEAGRFTVEAACDILGYPVSVVHLHDEDREVLVPGAMADTTGGEVGPSREYDLRSREGGQSLAFLTDEPVYVQDVDTDDRVSGPNGTVRSAMYFPLGDHGTLGIGATEPNAFGSNDRRIAGILADNAGSVLDRVARQTNLERERDRLAALFDNIPDPTIRVEFEDGQPVVEEANPAFEETFGYEESELRGHSVDRFIVPPGHRGEAEGYNRQIRDGEGFHGEVRRRAADGLRDFLLHVVPRTIDGEVTMGYAIYTDITERKQRERELERQNERLEEFASVVSHDLRNPLNVAEGRLELARESMDPADLDAVARSHDRMRELIDGLLELARQGRALGETAPLALDEAVDIAWGSVETNGARLVTDGLPTVRADRGRLCQLLENLFSNAVEHGSTSPDSQARQDAVEHGSTSPDSQARQDAVEHGTAGAESDGGTHDAGPPLTVTVGALEEGFFVADDGVGIPADRRERVFESGFTTGDGTTGFGLAIVRSIAEAHDWSVAVTEGRDGGVRFEFTGVDVVE